MTTQPLRIVYLIGQLGLGGSERQLYLLLKHMDRNRFECHVVVFNPSPNYTLDVDLRQAGVKVHTIPTNCVGIRRRMIWIYRLLWQLRPHVLHSWSIHDNAYAGVVGALAGVPRRLGSVRGSLASGDFKQFSLLMRWLILYSVQGHLVNSEAIANELRLARVPGKRIRVLSNCVEICQPIEITTFEDISSSARLVGMVGNLRREKNYLMFVRGMAKVLSEFPEVYGVIVGQPLLASDPELPDQIRLEIEFQGIQERLLMKGFHSKVSSILPNFEIFCLTSNFEGTPMRFSKRWLPDCQSFLPVSVESLVLLRMV
jgi:glycosyltransferase involved in cell wall biosynthesis